MHAISIGQKVNYVTSDGSVKPATVIEVIHESPDEKLARLDIGDGKGKHTALAQFNADKKTPNTFHETAAAAKKE
jgi:hypothetical protein